MWNNIKDNINNIKKVVKLVACNINVINIHHAINHFAEKQLLCEIIN